MTLPRIPLWLLLGVSAAWLVPIRAPAIAPPGAPGCEVFPANNHWHADVRDLPRHPRSDDWIRTMGGGGQNLHPDFGPSGTGQPYGIPYDVADDSHQDVFLDFWWPEESDPGPYPFGPDITIEAGSDQHALMLDRDACILYELFEAHWNGGDPWAGSGAVWDLSSNRLRHRGDTSADAAGLSVFAGLIRRDELKAGVIDHAIRMTAERTDGRYLWPARHEASDADNQSLPPMGAWFRLKRSFDISGYRTETRVVLRAMRVHGMIVADNGGNWFFGGASETGWRNAVLDELKSIEARNFVAVDAGAMKVDPDSGRVRPAYLGG